MSMPPTRTFKGEETTKIVRYGVPSETTQINTCVICQSNATPKPPVAPRKYKLKVWKYKGRVYSRLVADGKRRRGDGFRWVKPTKPLKITPSVWREPKPYSAALKEGNVNYFHGSHGYKTGAGGPLEISRVRYGQLISSDFGIALPAFPGYTPGLEDKAVTKALLKLKDSDINLGVAFGERKETTRMLLGTLKGLTKAARSLRKGNLKGVAEGLGLKGLKNAPRGQNFSNRWLELQYGWQPLYNDVFGAIQALHKSDLDDPRRYMVTVKGSSMEKKSVSRSDNLNYAVRAILQTDTWEGAFVRLDYYLENPLTRALSSLGITNPLEVAWELVPFSFVVDWFIPVGNYLSVLDADVGYKFRAGSLSRLYKQSIRGGIIASGHNPGYTPWNTYGSVVARSMNLDRIVYSRSPLPRAPSFKSPFSRNGRHIANAIALFASSLGHK